MISRSPSPIPIIRSSYDASEYLNERIQQLKPLNSVRELTLEDSKGEIQAVPLFLNQYAYQLEQLERLSIAYTDWAQSHPHRSFFLSLRLLTLLTSLKLSKCNFESERAFHRMLSELPALTALELEHVTWPRSLKLDRHPQDYRPLHLESLTMEDAHLEQKLAWVVRDTVRTFLSALSVKVGPAHSVGMLNPVFDCLGPSLESLELNFWERTLQYGVSEFGLPNNTCLKSFIVRNAPMAVISQYLAQINSTQLSTLIVFPSFKIDSIMINRAEWDAFLEVLARPVFSGIEHVEITWHMGDYRDSARRRCVRQLCQMLPEWLAPIKARAMLQIQIVGDVFEEDGPYTEGDLN